MLSTDYTSASFVYNTRLIRSQARLVCINKGRYSGDGEVLEHSLTADKRGEEEEVKMCAFTWRHTVAGGIGGDGVMLGRGLAQLPGGESVGRAWPARVHLLIQCQHHIIRHVG